MQRIRIYIIFGLILGPSLVFAQQMNSPEMKYNMNVSSQKQQAQDPSPDTPEWQLTLDVIKSKSEILLEANSKLVVEHRSLQAADQAVQDSVRDMELQNEALRQLLKQRKGHSEEQSHLDDLNNQTRSKENQIRQLQKKMDDLERQEDKLQRQLASKKLKMADLEVRRKKHLSKVDIKKTMQERVDAKKDDELTDLDKQLDYEKSQEEDLKTQLESLRQSFQKAAPQQAEDEKLIKVLQIKLDALRQEKEGLQKQGNVDNNQVKIDQYRKLAAKKIVLEAKIKMFESQLNQLKDPESLGMVGNRRKKQIVREMIQLDSQNAQRRQKIADMREDITLLRQQISRLERRADLNNEGSDK